MSKYGTDPAGLLKQLEAQQSFRRADPDEVANAIMFLNISSQQDHLFWIGRAFVSLRLPDLWQCVHESEKEGKYYIYTVTSQKLSIHPSLKYVLLMVQKARAQQLVQPETPESAPSLQQQASSAPEGLQASALYKIQNPQLMRFEDALGREHTIDMKELVQEKELDLQRNPDAQLFSTGKTYIMSKIATINIRDIKEEDRGNLQYQSEIQQLWAQYIGKALEDVEGKQAQEAADQSNNFESHPELLKMMKQPSPQKPQESTHHRISSNLKDNHLLSLCEVFKIQLPEDVHLLAVVCEYLLYKESYDQGSVWRFRTINDGSYYWFNTATLDTTRNCPFFSELRDLLLFYKKVVGREKLHLKLKKDTYAQLNKYLPEDEERAEVAHHLPPRSRPPGSAPAATRRHPPPPAAIRRHPLARALMSPRLCENRAADLQRAAGQQGAGGG